MKVNYVLILVNKQIILLGTLLQSQNISYEIILAPTAFYQIWLNGLRGIAH